MNTEGSSNGGEKRIKDGQVELSRALRAVRDLHALKRLPRELEPLLRLAPEPGATALVALHRSAPGRDASQVGRDMPDHASLDYWQPCPGYVARLWYEPCAAAISEDVSVVREVPVPLEPARVPAPLTVEVCDFVRELDRAERSGMPYVVLKWFLGTCLASSRLPWVGDQGVRQRVLSDAIELGLVTTQKVANPKNPAQPSTAVRLERSHPDVSAALGSPVQLPELRPVTLRGEPISETIIRERR